MIQHTPGPWRFALFESDPNEAFVQWRTGYAAVHGSRAGREANARLIATAPDMFLEIRRLHHRVERLRGLCKTASGWLLDAGRLKEADEVLRLVGDSEKPLP